MTPADTRSPQEPALKPEELLPCPFCGERLVQHTDHHGSWWAHRQEPGPCIDSTTQLFDEEDFRQWNTRPAPPAAAPVGELRDVLQRIANQKLRSEMDAELERWADWEGGYEWCVKYARKALSAAPVGELRLLERVQGRLDWIIAHGDASVETYLLYMDVAREVTRLSAAPVAGDRETAGVEPLREAVQRVVNHCKLQAVNAGGRIGRGQGAQQRGAGFEAKRIGEWLEEALMRWESYLAPIAYLRDVQPEAEDEALIVCAKGDPGCFPVFATPPSGGGDHAGGEGLTEWANSWRAYADKLDAEFDPVTQPDDVIVAHARAQTYRVCASTLDALARATAAPASGVEELTDEERAQAERVIRRAEWAGGQELRREDVPVFRKLLRLAASPKAQGSDVGLPDLTPSDWATARVVFLPANPNKMRSAAPEVKEIARKLVKWMEHLASSRTGQTGAGK